MRLRAEPTPTTLPAVGTVKFFLDIADYHVKTINPAGLVVDLQAAGGSDAHTHAQADVVGLAGSLGGKAATGHDHDADYDAAGAAATAAAGKADTAHGHAEADVTGLAADLGGKAASGHAHSGTYTEPSS